MTDLGILVGFKSFGSDLAVFGNGVLISCNRCATLSSSKCKFAVLIEKSGMVSRDVVFDSTNSTFISARIRYIFLA